MYDDTLPDRCRICGDRIDPCLISVGAHLLCTANAECRHELCLLLAGDLDDDYRLPISNCEGARR